MPGVELASHVILFVILADGAPLAHLLYAGSDLHHTYLIIQIQYNPTTMSFGQTFTAM